MDFDLPREVRLVRRSLREFAEQTIAPLVEGMEQRDEFRGIRPRGRPITDVTSTRPGRPR